MLPLLWSRDDPTWKKWHSSEYVVTSTRNKTRLGHEITEFSWTYQCEAAFKFTLPHNYCLENTVYLGGKKGRFKPGGKSVFGFFFSVCLKMLPKAWICFWLFTKFKSQYSIKRVEQNLSWYQFCAAIAKIINSIFLKLLMLRSLHFSVLSTRNKHLSFVTLRWSWNID